ncbi:MAG TPA: response regulator [Burkholderiales bacterium]|nr:response regulator [Burkholderiales bacterium]
MSHALQTVHIVDDDAAVRDSLSLLLELQGIAARAYASAEAFLEAYEGQPGCVVVDLRMPGMSGLALQAELKRRGIALPVVMVTAYGDVPTARAALKAGAFDFVEKPIEEDRLLATLEAALRMAQAERATAEELADFRARLERLTAREREVLDMVVEGRHNREIAEALAISPRTVEVYRARMMEKLHVRRLPDLVRLMLRQQPRAPAGK